MFLCMTMNSGQIKSRIKELDEILCTSFLISEGQDIGSWRCKAFATIIAYFLFLGFIDIAHHSADFFYFLSFCLIRLTPVAYGGSQARGLIRSTAAGHSHSQSNARLEPMSATYTTAHGNTRSLTH